MFEFVKVMYRILLVSFFEDVVYFSEKVLFNCHCIIVPVIELPINGCILYQDQSRATCSFFGFLMVTLCSV